VPWQLRSTARADQIAVRSEPFRSDSSSTKSPRLGEEAPDPDVETLVEVKKEDWRRYARKGQTMRYVAVRMSSGWASTGKRPCLSHPRTACRRAKCHHSLQARRSDNQFSSRGGCSCSGSWLVGQCDVAYLARRRGREPTAAQHRNARHCEQLCSADEMSGSTAWYRPHPNGPVPLLSASPTGDDHHNQRTILVRHCGHG
jgi:hypothetical protein